MVYICPKCNTVIRTGEKDARAHYKKCGVPWAAVKDTWSKKPNNPKKGSSKTRKSRKKSNR